jgi:hypothetical protein
MIPVFVEYVSARHQRFRVQPGSERIRSDAAEKTKQKEAKVKKRLQTNSNLRFLRYLL